MAATRLIALHVNKGKTVAQCLADRTNYAQNGAKTEDGTYVTGYECDPETCDEEFLLSKRQYQEITGRVQKNDVIAYQIRQSFKPGEVTAEEANQIGYELGMRFTKGKHAFIVATHTDKAHIHNHIVFNSTSLDCTSKFKDFHLSGIALRRVSDRICAEHGLSIIIPRAYRDREKYQDPRFKKSIRDEIREALDNAIAAEPKDLDDLLKRLEHEGWLIRRDKRLAIKKLDGRKFILFKSLGKGYTEDDLVRRIFGEEFVPEKKAYRQEQKVFSLIDLQKKLQEGKGGGYQRWGKIFNVKQTAKTIAFLKEKGLLDYDELKQAVDGAADRFTELGTSIKAKEKRLGEIRTLRTHIINYARTRDVYVAYRKSGYSKMFYEAHTEEIILHKAAKDAFEEMQVDKLPTVKQLNQEFNEVLMAKKQDYDEYRRLKNELRELQIAKKNMEVVLDIETEKDKREHVLSR